MVRDFGYDYDYGYGYVKSVDSMDNVNSVRCGNGLDNVNSTNSAPFLPAAPLWRRITWYHGVGAVDIAQVVATAHAGVIVHAVHTLDLAIAIVIVIAKVTNTG